MSLPNPLVPAVGNPYRPMFFLLSVCFGAMLIGFPALMYVVGLGTGSIVAIAIMIIVVTLVCMGFILWLAHSVEDERVGLQAGNAWVTWHLSEKEYREFVRSERRRSIALALAYAVVGLCLGIYFTTVANDRLTGYMLIAGSLIASGITVTMGGPPWRATEQARVVRIGERGVQALGRYLPLKATALRLTAVDLKSGTPAVLLFVVRTGRRSQVIRVPVAHGHGEEAEAMVERFRNHVANQPDASWPLPLW